MAIKFIQEKEKQQTLVYVLVFLMVFFLLFLWKGISFDFSAKEILQKEDVVEINFSALDEIGIEKLREFSVIPPYKESTASQEGQEGQEVERKIGRANPLLPSSMIPITISGEEEIEFQLSGEESDEREEFNEGEELDEKLGEELEEEEEEVIE